ncbi:hypothetical protein D3C80_1030230 [compost metagenome]
MGQVDHGQRDVAFKVGIVGQYAQGERSGLGGTGVVAGDRCLVGRPTHCNRHGGRYGLHIIGVHGAVGEGRGERRRNGGRWRIDQCRRAAERNSTLACGRLRQVGDGQWAIGRGVVGQHVEGQRGAGYCAGTVSHGLRQLVDRAGRGGTNDRHRLGIGTTGGRLDGNAGRRLWQVIDDQLLVDTGPGQAAESLGHQIRHHDFIAGRRLDGQPVVAPVVAGGLHLDHVGELGRLRGRPGGAGGVGRGHDDELRCRAGGRMLAEKQPVGVGIQVDRARHRRVTQAQGIAVAQLRAVRRFGEDFHLGAGPGTTVGAAVDL